MSANRAELNFCNKENRVKLNATISSGSCEEWGLLAGS